MNIQDYLNRADMTPFDQGKYEHLDAAVGRYLHHAFEARLHHRIALTEFVTVERFNEFVALVARLRFSIQNNPLISFSDLYHRIRVSLDEMGMALTPERRLALATGIDHLAFMFQPNMLAFRSQHANVARDFVRILLQVMYG